MLIVAAIVYVTICTGVLGGLLIAFGAERGVKFRESEPVS